MRATRRFTVSAHLTRALFMLCVRWYVTYWLSYRRLADMMAERGVKGAHSTILCWVTRYVSEFEKRWRPFFEDGRSSWRIDETYAWMKAKWHYLYPLQWQRTILLWAWPPTPWLVAEG